jgi:hypothetical protein
MKNFSILIFALLVALTGCKPKQTALSGQMFIVTQGAENVKLGDVQISLIDKSQASDFLLNKQTSIETELAARKNEIGVAERRVASVQTDYDSFQTNSDYVELESELDNVSKEHEDLEQKLRSLPQDSDENEKTLKEVGVKYAKQYELQQKLDDMRKAREPKINELLNDIQTADLLLATAKTRLENFPMSEDYLADFSPLTIQQTRTDADGKFSFVYSRDKSLAIFASAQRMVLNKIEKYYWLVNAPTNAESVQIFLSNNNLVEVDPDGYFTLKPKQVSDESVVP